MFVRTSHEKLLKRPSPSLHPVFDLPLCGSYQETDRLILQLVTPRLALYLTQHPLRLLLSAVLLQLLSSTLPPKARQDTKQQHRHQASSLRLARIADSPPKARQAVSHRIPSCLAASRALPVLPAAPPRHRPGVSTQSSDLHKIQFCHLTACRDLALPDQVRSAP